VSGKFYIGKRKSNIKPHLDLGIKYFSSSSDKDFMLDQKQHQEKFKYEVLSIWNTVLEILNEEIRLHKLYNMCRRNPLSYNITKVGGMDTTGMGVFKNKISKEICLLSVDDPRIGTEFEGIVKGISIQIKRHMILQN
jgi:hypothetical protein